MKNILLPTDFSDNSRNAISYALQLYKNTTCNFYILNITSAAAMSSGETPYFPTANVIEDSLLVPAKARLQKLVRNIEKKYFNTKHRFITLTEYDFLVDAIKRQVQEKNIDLIVMGTKGASGLKEVIVGSNTGDVITRVKCPVLIIPENAKYTEPQELAFPTDYNIFYQNNILETISEMISMTKARLRVLNISKKNVKLTHAQKQNQEFLEEYFKDEALSFHALSNEKIEDAVQCFVESRDIDMITMVAKNLNLFQQILFHPTVEKISYHTEIPFLVLHE